MMRAQRGKSRRLLSLLVVAVAVLLGVTWSVRTRRRKPVLPPRIPRAEELSLSGLLNAKQAYFASLNTSRDRDAFQKGYAVTTSKLATWGPNAGNLGESSLPAVENYDPQSTAAFAMGMHFAMEEAKKRASETRAPAATGPDPGPPQE